MTDKLSSFLTRNDACIEVLARLDATGATTPEEAWERADASDLIWAVTRPGVMAPEQRRQFLVFVLESIEDKLTDPRSKNILEKLRTKSPLTEADARAADAAAAWADAAALAADAASWAAADAASWAAWSAAYAAALAADAAALAAAAAAERAAQADAAAREKQAQWIRDNFVLTDLNIN